MANAARLEVDFPFGGKTYTIKPTFEVIGSIETATGRACISLADTFYATDPKDYASLALTAQVIYFLLKPQEKDLTADRVGEVLMENGCAPFWTPLGNILGRALKGNKEHIRIAEEAARKEAAQQQGGTGPQNEGQETDNALSSTG